MGANDSSFHFFSLFGGSAEALKGTLWALLPRKIHKRSILKKGIINLSTIREGHMTEGWILFLLQSYSDKSSTLTMIR